MNFAHKLTLAALSLLMGSCSATDPDKLISSNFEFANQQLRLTLSEADRIRTAEGKTIYELVSPRSIKPDGSMFIGEDWDWCGGFFPGELWYMYEYTGDEFWKTEADRYTRALESQKDNKTTHDLGFMMYCSYGNGYRLAPSDYYRDVLIESATSLASRYDSTVGAIRSWDFSPEKWQFPVIIDNMMNLELLFWATRATGDSSFYNVAIAHANTTLKNHFREDNSCVHVVDYDTVTGKVIKRITHQGYSDESSWARGQAWALYGYTMCYRETGDVRYRDHAEKVAQFIFTHPRLPEDLIPYWDYDAPEIPNAPRDASSATITASALYQLSTMTGKAEAKQYRAWADQILENLTAHYRVTPGEKHGFLLNSSTGNVPEGGEINTPIVYGDYYFLEALLRKKHLTESGKL